MTETPHKEASLPVSSAAMADQFQEADLHLWHKPVNTDRASLIKFARWVMLIVVGIGGIWASTAKIGGAVIGSGRVIVEGRNQVIQHLEGGILTAILVQEGDRVKKGDIVARLDETQVRSRLNAEQLQAAILRIQLARRRTEIAEETRIDFPRDFPAWVAKHPRVTETMESQQSEFEAQLKLRNTEIKIVEGQIKAANGEAQGGQNVKAAQQRQADLLRQELTNLDDLVQKDLIRLSDIFARQRALADIEARIASTEQTIIAAKARAGNLENEILQTRQNYLREANNALVQIQQSLNQTEDSISRLADVLDRQAIRSPVDGTIFRISKQTLGAVVQPAESLLEILPNDGAFTIEAYVEPKDIEQVSLGQAARVVFPSNRDEGLVPIPGKVVYLSADALVNEQNPQGSYIARVAIEDPDFDLLPGNAAEVYFQTTPKTFFQYVTEPITRFAFRAFKG